MIDKKFVEDLCQSIIEAERQAKSNPNVPGAAFAVPMAKMAKQILALVNKDVGFFLESIVEIEARLVSIEKRITRLEELSNER